MSCPPISDVDSYCGHTHAWIVIYTLPGDAAIIYSD